MMGAFPPIIISPDESWEFTIEKQTRLVNFMNNKVGVLLLDAVTQIVNIAKTLTIEHYPPPSSPGNPPHQRTGRLWDSIDIFRISNNFVEFGVDAPYAGFLEFGTSRMLPRPFMIPAINEIQDLFPELIFDNMKAELA